MVTVGTDLHAFLGDGEECEGILGNSDGPVCGARRVAFIHRVEGTPYAAATPSTSAQLRQVQEALAASQQDLTRSLDARDAWHRVAERVTTQRDLAAAEVEQLRTAVAGVLAELRGLAGDARAEAAPFRHTSSPFGFGPHRAAEAYEKAAALLEALGGEDRG